MIHLKDRNVSVAGLRPEMYFAAAIVDAAFAKHDLECIVTSAVDGVHNPASLHSLGYALDFRIEEANLEQRLDITLQLQRLEKYGFDVVLETFGTTPATTAPHIHVEYQPKQGERVNIFQ